MNKKKQKPAPVTPEVNMVTVATKGYEECKDLKNYDG